MHNSSNRTRCCETAARERCIIAALASGGAEGRVHQGRSAGPLSQHEEVEAWLSALPIGGARSKNRKLETVRLTA